MTAAATLDTVVGAVLDQCTARWERTNDLPPLLWAIGRERSIFAQPFDAIGLNLDRRALIGLHSVLSHHVGGVFLGRADEAFTHLRDDTEVIDAGDLSRLADTDPTITRAICVEGLDTTTDDTRLHVARFILDDDGYPTWSTSEGVAEGELSQWNRLAAEAAGLLTHSMNDGDLQRFAFSVHWSVVTSPTGYVLP